MNSKARDGVAVSRASACRAGAILAGFALTLLGGCVQEPSRKELIEKGDWYFWQAEHMSAIGPYMAAYEMDPADPNVLFKIGECHFYLRTYREACKWYRQTIKSFPGHREAAARLKEAESKLPSYAPEPTSTTGPEAVNAPKPSEVAQGFINNAMTYEAAGDQARALDSFKRAVEAADDQAFTHAALGRYYMRTGRNAEALVQLKQAQHLNPSEPGIGEDLAKLGAK
mgnify:CR=1 FL=1